LLEGECLLLVVDVVVHQLRARRTQLVQVELGGCPEDITRHAHVAVPDLRFQQTKRRPVSVQSLSST